MSSSCSLVRRSREQSSAITRSARSGSFASIGMTRESVNKQLRAWEERNWIRLQRGSVVVLDPAALAALNCNDVADAA